VFTLNPRLQRRQRPNLNAFSGSFENEVTTRKLAGAIVLIQQHGLPVYFKRFGVQDVATKQPMTPDTIFALHSMTKPITNQAAMMLIDDGKLALDDPVSKYIPAFAAVKVGVESETKEGQRRGLRFRLPFERQGRLLRSRSISGLSSRSLSFRPTTFLSTLRNGRYPVKQADL
jgi:CubicO group peptidase (beta-lactamase class C family)